MTQQPASFDPRRQRARVRRTVWTFALIALAIYVGFLVSGTLGR